MSVGRRAEPADDVLAAPRSRPRPRAGPRGRARAACPRRCGSACARAARRPASGSPAPGAAAARELGVAGRRRVADLADLVQHREQRHQVGGEVGEVGRRRELPVSLQPEVLLDRARRSPGTAKARSCSTERPCSTRICRALASALQLVEQPRLADPRLARRPPRTGTRRPAPRSAAAAARANSFVPPDEGRERRPRRLERAGEPGHRSRSRSLSRSRDAVAPAAPRPPRPPAAAAARGSFARQARMIALELLVDRRAPSARGDCGISCTIR